MNNLTIIIIDTRQHANAMAVLTNCLASLLLSKGLYISDKNIIPPSHSVDFEKINEISSIQQYNTFVLKELHKHVTTDFCLIIQTDGFIINPRLWNDIFLQYDFIGAPLSDFPEWLGLQPFDFQEVFKAQNFDANRWPMNGGFSLRSKRLLELTAQCPFPIGDIAEDNYINIYHRGWFEERGVKFAPRDLAYSFSKESPLKDGDYDFTKSFGFHGKMTPKHTELMKIPLKSKSKILVLKKWLGINEDISLKHFITLKLKSRDKTSFSRQDFFDYYVNYTAPRGKIKPQFDIKIDLVINAIEKDLDTLPLAVAQARKNILHTIENVYIVTPDREIFRQFCNNNACTWINEADVLPFNKKDINYKVNGNDRSGWLFQQLLKLHADKFCQSENIVLLDADTILTRQRVYLKGKRRILEFSDEFHRPYFQTYEKLTGYKHHYPISFVCHTMLFEKQRLRALRQHVEKDTGLPFFQAVINNANPRENSIFSEFETYANFVLEKYRREYDFEYWRNQAESKELLMSFDYFRALYEPSGVKSISFHSYTTTKK